MSRSATSRKSPLGGGAGGSISRPSGAMSPPSSFASNHAHATASSSASHVRPSPSPSLPGGFQDHANRPSSAASHRSARRTAESGIDDRFAHAAISSPSPASSSAVRTQKIKDLVVATVPAARPRRSETNPQKVQERQAFFGELVDLMDDILVSGTQGQASQSAVDQEHVMAQLKRKLSRQDPDGGQGLYLRLESLVSKLKRQPDVSSNANGLLQVFEKLAFTSRTPAFESDAGGSMPRSRSSLLNVPASRSGSRRGSNTSTKEALHDVRRAVDSPTLATADSHDSMPFAPISPRMNNVAEEDSDHIPDQEFAQKVNRPRYTALSEEDLTLTKTKLLERWRARNNSSLISETELLSDVIFMLQGINGKHVGFEESVLPASNDLGEMHEPEKILIVKFYGDAERLITAPTKALIHQIVELGSLYKRIEEFQRSRSMEEGVGMIMQSFCHFLSSEMTDYYRLIALLESQLKQQQSMDLRNGSNAPLGPSGSEEKDASRKGLTLRRVAVWTKDVLLRMRLISTLIESCKEVHGGTILSFIHTYTFHGDPLIQKYTAETLDHVAKPFFRMLSLWIFEGELQDPFGEFFVESNKVLKSGWPPADAQDEMSALYMNTSQDPSAPPPSSLWANQFRFRAEMLPSFLDESFGKKIFSAGKSVNFIRFSCNDAEWVVENVASRRDKTTALRYANLPELERTIDDAYASASTRLLDIFLGKFKLMSHLRALKDYLMLTKGDFIDLLMESLGPRLDQPASTLFRHDLTASLETAIRGSNSQYDDVDILRRLDARILDFNEGDLGWDTFTLEYRIDEPVSTVLDNDAMLGYQVIFSHLWKVKRVELTLGRCWERLLLATNMLRRVQPREIKVRRPMSAFGRDRRPGSAASTATATTVKETVISDKGSTAAKSGDAELLRVAHTALGHLGEQIHFIKQMQGFVSLEVIEYSWNDLTQLFASHTTKKRLIDLDELITSHRAYLHALIAKVMLRGGGKSDQLGQEVRVIIELMLTFARAIEDLARLIADEMAQRELESGTQPRHHTSRREGSGSSDAAPSGTPSAALGNIQSRIRSTHERFQASSQTIIGKLEKHSNLVVRDLATRLNFNSYYNPLAAGSLSFKTAASSHAHPPASAADPSSSNDAPAVHADADFIDDHGGAH